LNVTFDPDAYKGRHSDPFIRPFGNAKDGMDLDELGETELETFSLGIVASEF
jgi:hypothetical protein